MLCNEKQKTLVRHLREAQVVLSVEEFSSYLTLPKQANLEANFFVSHLFFLFLLFRYILRDLHQ